jgi:hypothetical protein
MADSNPEEEQSDSSAILKTFTNLVLHSKIPPDIG